MEIINKDLKLDVYGFSAVSANKDYVGTAFTLMGRMWEVVKSNNLKNKGLNIFVYGDNENVFAGVELEETPDPGTGLELKQVLLTHYAYYKHVGPYNLIKHAGQAMKDELKEKGLTVTLPYIEIYGHWTNDDSKLETELFMCLE